MNQFQFQLFFCLLTKVSTLLSAPKNLPASSIAYLHGQNPVETGDIKFSMAYGCRDSTGQNETLQTQATKKSAESEHGSVMKQVTFCTVCLLLYLGITQPITK